MDQIRRSLLDPRVSLDDKFALIRKAVLEAISRNDAKRQGVAAAPVSVEGTRANDPSCVLAKEGHDAPGHAPHCKEVQSQVSFLKENSPEAVKNFLTCPIDPSPHEPGITSTDEFGVDENPVGWEENDLSRAAWAKKRTSSFTRENVMKGVIEKPWSTLETICNHTGINRNSVYPSVVYLRHEGRLACFGTGRSILLVDTERLLRDARAVKQVRAHAPPPSIDPPEPRRGPRCPDLDVLMAVSLHGRALLAEVAAELGMMVTSRLKRRIYEEEMSGRLRRLKAGVYELTDEGRAALAT